MTDPRIDAERLAALLDRRLDERQRAELLEHLAASEEDFDVFVDAVAVTRELEGASEAEDVIPLRPPAHGGDESASRGKGAGGPWRWLALAAVLAAIALAPWLWMRAGARDPLGDPGHYVALLEAEDAGLPPAWEGRPWTVTRAPGDPLTPETRAARLGARLVNLDLAVRARDTAAAQLAAEIAVLLEEIPAAGPVASVYREIGRRAGEPPQALAPLLERGRVGVTRLAGEELVALAAWVEAARIAAARQDLAFFRARASRAALERAAELPILDGPARESLERVQTMLASADAPDWDALQRELTELLRALGS